MVSKNMKSLKIESTEVVEALAHTKLFKLMAGNPLTICMMASCYVSPFN